MIFFFLNTTIFVQKQVINYIDLILFYGKHLNYNALVPLFKRNYVMFFHDEISI